MTVSLRRRSSALLAAGVLAASLVLPALAAAAAGPPGGTWTVPPLPVGPADLPQSQTVTQLAPGLTLTRIVRGAVDPATVWVVEMSIPGGTSSPDPDAPPRSVQDQASATRLAAELTAGGFPAQAQPVVQPQVADVAAGIIGYRVRLTASYPTKAAADAALAAVRAIGYSGRSWYTGWDGGGDARGRLTVEVLTIDPRTFRGTLGATYGPDLEQRETTTALARLAGAKAAINAGFFVLDPAAGAPGDPAGVGVYDGRLESETVAGRPALVIDDRARHTAVVRPVWSGTVTAGGRSSVLDGINRVPGLIRNCGGLGDLPTTVPLHDITCTDADELVVFDDQFGAHTPAGPGMEVVLDSRGHVTSVARTRGTVLAAGQRSIQATGARVGELQLLASANRIGVTLRLTDGSADLVRPGRTVVNGGPQLMAGGRIHITQATDGMVHPSEPAFAYGWVLQRNPRTFAGVDALGRTLLVTSDGRQLGEMGLSIPETAAVAKALGMVEAINLDGGGSTAMAIDGALITSPSDATGERPVGDAIVIG